MCEMQKYYRELSVALILYRKWKGKLTVLVKCCMRTAF